MQAAPEPPGIKAPAGSTGSTAGLSRFGLVAGHAGTWNESSAPATGKRWSAPLPTSMAVQWLGSEATIPVEGAQAARERTGRKQMRGPASVTP